MTDNRQEIPGKGCTGGNLADHEILIARESRGRSAARERGGVGLGRKEGAPSVAPFRPSAILAVSGGAGLQNACSVKATLAGARGRGRNETAAS